MIRSHNDFEINVVRSGRSVKRPYHTIFDDGSCGDEWQFEKYESVYEPIPMTSNRSMLLHLMDAQDLAAADLVEILGSLEILEKVLSGQQPIDSSQIQLLADRLNVPSQVLS